MTRRSVIASALVAFIAASALTLTSIILPRWISWDTSLPGTTPVHVSYGLHKRCSSLTDSCVHFPSDSFCQGAERSFCSMWRSAGFLMSFAVVVEGMTLVAFVVMLVGGKQKRQQGWGILAGFLGLGALVQVAAMALVVSVKQNDGRFIDGFRLAEGWQLCTTSWVLLLATGVGVVASRYLLEEEGGYELIPGAS